jgi:hypothetical protein
MCDHTPQERNQSEEDTHRPLTEEEENVYKGGNKQAILKIANQRTKMGNPIFPCLIVFETSLGPRAMLGQSKGCD